MGVVVLESYNVKPPVLIQHGRGQPVWGSLDRGKLCRTKWARRALARTKALAALGVVREAFETEFVCRTNVSRPNAVANRLVGKHI